MTRRADVVQVVLDLLPDIVGFQEMTNTHRLPASEQPPAFMKARLEAAGYRIVPGIGGSPKSIFYKASRFSLEASSMPHATYLWPDRRTTMCPDEGLPVFVNEASGRTVNWCMLRDKQSGGRLLVVNTHLSAGKQISAVRVHQTHCIRQIVDRIAGGLPVVVFGDFNATINTLELRQLVDPSLAGAPPLTDTGSPPGKGSFNGFCEKNCKPRGKIDFVLERGLRIVEPARVITLKPGGRWPSDHMPVLATLEFPSRDGSDAGTAQSAAVVDAGG